eukprot:6926316-Prymnesium_polylepis.1
MDYSNYFSNESSVGMVFAWGFEPALHTVYRAQEPQDKRRRRMGGMWGDSSVPMRYTRCWS